MEEMSQREPVSDADLRARREVAHEYHAKLAEPFHNSFVSMHLQAAKKLNITNCWICTHAPISHKTFSSLLGIPSTLTEIEDSAYFGEVSRTMIDRAISLLLFTNAPLRKPVVCINFTRTYTPELLSQGYQDTTRLIGNSNCMDNADIKYWFDGKDVVWSTDRYQKLHDYTHRQHSRQNNMKLLMCLQGYNFNKACAAPPGYYFICGKKAYTWVPLNSNGVCYFGRVVPATWYMEDNDFQETQLHKIPIHFLTKDLVHLIKRDLTDQSAPGEDEIPGGKEEEDSEINVKNDYSPDWPTCYPKSDDNFTNIESHDREIKPLFSIPWVNRCCIKKAFSFIIDLADLMDNITALYDRNFIAFAIELKMIKKKRFCSTGWCWIISRPVKEEYAP